MNILIINKINKFPIRQKPERNVNVSNLITLKQKCFYFITFKAKEVIKFYHLPQIGIKGKN